MLKLRHTDFHRTTTMLCPSTSLELIRPKLRNGSGKCFVLRNGYTVETCFSVAASFDTNLQLFMLLATLSQLHGDVWSNKNSFVQPAGKDGIKVAVAYDKTPP